MLVISWNVKAIRGVGAGRFTRLFEALRQEKPDILLLQEVGAKPPLVERIKDELDEFGLHGFFFSGSHDDNGKAYGNVIASRGPVEPNPAGWAVGAPYENLLARARVHAEDHVVDVISAHIPNGSDHGWQKIETFEALAAALQNAPDQPRILGGDFNEPREVRASGQMVTFGQKIRADGTVSSSGPKTDRRGELHPLYRWDHAVRSVLAGVSSHGLRHTYHDRHGWSSPVTHVIRGSERFFDHLLVSHHFAVEESGYFHNWREQGLSDHSAPWARLRI